MPHARRRYARRSGAILAAVLVCLLVVTLVSASLVKLIVLQHRQTDAQLQQLQAFWLAEAGFQAAARELERDPDLSGKEWKVPVLQQGAQDLGTIQIGVEDVAATSQRRLTVDAYWPDDPVHRYLEQRTSTYPLERGAQP